MTKMSWGEVLERAVWAGVESGLAVLTVESLGDVTLPMLQLVGLTAGISFLKSVMLQRQTVLGRFNR